MRLRTIASVLVMTQIAGTSCSIALAPVAMYGHECETVPPALAGAPKSSQVAVSDCSKDR
jgi:hypothetical protein